jgi:hypothetical protein
MIDQSPVGEKLRCVMPPGVFVDKQDVVDLRPMPPIKRRHRHPWADNILDRAKALDTLIKRTIRFGQQVNFLFSYIVFFKVFPVHVTTSVFQYISAQVSLDIISLAATRNTLYAAFSATD